LLTDNENTLPTYHPKIKIARVESFNNKEMQSKLNALLNNLYTLTKQDIFEFFSEMVPEYKTNDSNYYKITKTKNSANINSIVEKNSKFQSNQV
jgi:hypothetical protein